MYVKCIVKFFKYVGFGFRIFKFKIIYFGVLIKFNIFDFFLLNLGNFG